MCFSHFFLRMHCSQPVSLGKLHAFSFQLCFYLNFICAHISDSRTVCDRGRTFERLQAQINDVQVLWLWLNKYRFATASRNFGIGLSLACSIRLMSLPTLLFAQLCAGKREKSLTHHLEQRNAMHKLWTFERAHIQARDEYERWKVEADLFTFLFWIKMHPTVAVRILHNGRSTTQKCTGCNSLLLQRQFRCHESNLNQSLFRFLHHHSKAADIYWLCCVSGCLESPSPHSIRKTFTVENYCLFSFTILLRPYSYWILALKLWVVGS